MKASTLLVGVGAAVAGYLIVSRVFPPIATVDPTTGETSSKANAIVGLVDAVKGWFAPKGTTSTGDQVNTTVDALQVAIVELAATGPGPSTADELGAAADARVMTYATSTPKTVALAPSGAAR